MLEIFEREFRAYKDKISNPEVDKALKIENSNIWYVIDFAIFSFSSTFLSGLSDFILLCIGWRTFWTRLLDRTYILTILRYFHKRIKDSFENREF
jgi:hypothetical protein